MPHCFSCPKQWQSHAELAPNSHPNYEEARNPVTFWVRLYGSVLLQKLRTIALVPYCNSSIMAWPYKQWWNSKLSHIDDSLWARGHLELWLFIAVQWFLQHLCHFNLIACWADPITKPAQLAISQPCYWPMLHLYGANSGRARPLSIQSLTLCLHASIYACICIFYTI